MRRNAGTAMPMPIPVTKRPMSSGVTEVDMAIITRPTTLRAIPVNTSRRAWPLSANGAIVTWARNPAKNPTPITAPRADSEMPYSSRKSSSIANSTP